MVSLKTKAVGCGMNVSRLKSSQECFSSSPNSRKCILVNVKAIIISILLISCSISDIKNTIYTIQLCTVSLSRAQLESSIFENFCHMFIF